MTSKKRRSKKTDTEAQGVAPESPAADPAATDGETVEVADAQKPKRSLPAFGFASDLLKKKDADGVDAGAGTAASEAGDPAAPADQLPSEALLARPTSELPPIGDEDPNRLFTFADQLASFQQSEQKDQGPKARWETWVTFSLADETFAMPVEPVRQVVRVANITRVPHAPRPVRGVTNLRGRVIPVVDLRMRVGLPQGKVDRQSRVVAVASRGRVLGLLVDAVHQVVHLDLNRVQPPPEDVMSVQSDYILGVYHMDSSLILLLDVDRALILRDQVAA